MISWIQTTFQRHFRTIFFIVLAGVIVSFIYGINASSGLGRADRKLPPRPFFDLDLSKAEDQQRLGGDARLSVVLQAGYDALQPSQLNTYALTRYAALHLGDTLGVPAPTPAEITEYVQSLGMFTGQDGKFDPKRYNDFRDNLKTNPSLSEADVSRVVADDVRAANVRKLLAGPGYVLPADVKTQLELAESKWTLAVATVDFASFSPKIDAGPTALTNYFNANPERYETPAKVRADYVEFSAAAYLSKVDASDAAVRAFYDANPARFPKPKDAPKPAVPLAPAAPGPDADFAAVRPQVETAYKLEQARRLAADAAADLSVSIFENKIGVDQLPDFLAKHGLTLKSAPPISQDAVPAELGGRAQVATEAFKLSEKRPVSDPLTTPNGAVLLVWRESIAPKIPALADVKEKVEQDYREDQKHRLFTELGAKLRTEIQAAVKSGKSFADAAKAAADSASVKIELKDYPAFTLRQPPSDIDRSALGTLDTLAKGQVSAMVVSGDKGLLVYGADKAVPDLTPANTLYAQTRDNLAQRIAAANGQAYLQALVEKELGKAPELPN